MIRLLCVYVFFYIIPLLSFCQNFPEIVLPLGHASSTKSIEISTDRKYLLTASTDNTVKLWDYINERLIVTIDSTGVESAHFSSDGKYFVTYSTSINKVRIWQTKTASVIQSIPLFASYVDFSKDNKVLLITFESSISKWETFTGKKIQLLGSCYSSVGGARINKSGEFYICDSENFVVFKDLQTDASIKKIPFPASYPYYALSNNDNYLLFHLSITDKNKIIIYDVSNGVKKWDFNGFFTGRSDNEAIKFSSDDKYLFSSDYLKNRLYVWDLLTGKSMLPFEIGESGSSINDYAISLDSKNVIIQQSDQACIFDISNCRLIANERGFYDKIGFVDSNHIFSQSKNPQIFSFPQLTPFKNFKGKSEKIEITEYDSTSKTFICGVGKEAHFWNLMKQRNDFITGKILDISLDKKRILVERKSSRMFVLSAQTGNVICELEQKEGGFLYDNALFFHKSKFIVARGVSIVYILIRKLVSW